MQGLEERADAIEPHVGTGTWVKVGLRRERFWCKVQRVRSDGALVTSVENNLQLSTLRCGDEIVLSRRNVLEVVDDSDRLLYEVVVHRSNRRHRQRPLGHCAREGAVPGRFGAGLPCWRGVSLFEVCGMFNLSF